MIVEFHTHNVVQYKFEDEAEQVTKKEQDDFTSEINDAISDGEVTPPKSKKLDLLPRLATWICGYAVNLFKKELRQI
jgi:hypothetical protein